MCRLELWDRCRVRVRFSALCDLFDSFFLVLGELVDGLVVADTGWVAWLEGFVVFGLADHPLGDGALDVDSVFADDGSGTVENAARMGPLREGFFLHLLLQDAVMLIKLLASEHFASVVLLSLHPGPRRLSICQKLRALADLALLERVRQKIDRTFQDLSGFGVTEVLLAERRLGQWVVGVWELEVGLLFDVSGWLEHRLVHLLNFFHLDFAVQAEFLSWPLVRSIYKKKGQ